MAFTPCRPLLYGFLIYLIFAEHSGVTGNSSADPAVLITPAALDESVQNMLQDAGLTRREIEIALLVRSGLTNQEIADKLFISTATVKKHISNIFEKLGLQNREQLRKYS